MLIKRAADIRSSEITDKRLYHSRREFLQTAAGTVAVAAAGVVGGEALLDAETPAPHGRKLEHIEKSPLSTDERPNTWEQITTYNNYYEFGTDKDSPSMYARQLQARAVDGHGRRRVRQERQRCTLEDILKGQTLEERIYRHRCVEAWSMVIPWVGFPLADLIKKCEPTSKAKYVEFTTLYDPKQMPGVRAPRAALAVRRRAAHGRGDAPADAPRRRPLRRGAAEPERRAAAARRAVEVRLQGHQVDREDPVRREAAAEHLAGVSAANEYGFYANVNPTVDHPRWSQATERRIGEFLHAEDADVQRLRRSGGRACTRAWTSRSY